MTHLSQANYSFLRMETVISSGKPQNVLDYDETTDDLRSTGDCTGAAESIDGSGPLAIRLPNSARCRA
jgi:hypothetical protein